MKDSASYESVEGSSSCPSTHYLLSFFNSILQDIIYFNEGSKLKKRGEMATEVALPDITKYLIFNVNEESFTLVRHGKTACSFIRMSPQINNA